MTQYLRKNALAHFALLPKPHQLGLVILCGLLFFIGLSKVYNSEEQSVPVHHTSLLTASVHTQPPNEVAEKVAIAQISAPELLMTQNHPSKITTPQVNRPKAASTQITLVDAPSITEQASIPFNLIAEEAPPSHIETNTAIIQEVKSGDTLASVFNRAGVASKYMYHLLHNHEKAKTLARIFPGHKLKFVLSNEKKLIALHHIKNQLSEEVFTRTEPGYKHVSIVREPEIRLVRTEGVITHSLYSAAKEAKLEDRLTMSLASIFGWDVDFALDIRENDRFVVLYEERYLNNKLLGTGNIIAAEFINKGNSYKAVRYTDTNGNAQYYTPEGNTMRKAFLRSPIEFARISSHFNLNRKHPVLNTIRAHKGTDYAAPRGTPVKTTGDGKVVFAGRKGGYGNVLIIQHGQSYETRYAHLKSFAKNIRRGKTVKQGQVVAYVGTTGLSSGPHLHYEFRVNGAVRNPVTVKLPKANPIAKAERGRFFNQTKRLIARLNNLPEATQIATQEADSPSTKAATTAM